MMSTELGITILRRLLQVLKAYVHIFLHPWGRAMLSSAVHLLNAERDMVPTGFLNSIFFSLEQL